MLLWPVLLLAAAGLISPYVARSRIPVWLLAAAPAGVFAWLLSSYLRLGVGETTAESLGWFDPLGASLDFVLDGFGGLLALLISGVGTLIVIYASGYLAGHRDLGRLLLLLFFFMASMLGLVLADNVILLFVFWELTSITSYLLVGFNHEDKAARAKALQALLVTGAGGLAMLAGFILLGTTAESWRLSEIVQAGDLVRSSPVYGALTACIIIGAAAKSAQVPLHFWLPNAMAAPTPVSAFLHSATMVKAGVFLLAKLSPALDGTLLWHGSLSVLGSATLITGAVLGIVQTDLKRILAYTTLSVLGILTLLIGIGTELAIKSMVVFLLGHALYKAALFMVAGTVDHETGTRDVRRLGGLRRAMPVTAVAALLAAFSKAGFPPFFGFVGKEYVYKTGTALDQAGTAFIVVAVVGNMFLLALALKAGLHPFWSKTPLDAPGRTVHEAPWSLWGPPLALALCGLAFGLAAGLVGEALVGKAVAAIRLEPMTSSLSLWHGLSLPLVLSVVTMAGGLLIYANRRLIWPHRGRIEAVPGPSSVYETMVGNLAEVAKRKTRILQSGALTRYVAIVIAAATFLLGWKFLRFGGWPDLTIGPDIEILPAVLCVLAAGAALGATIATSRLGVLVALGIVGIAIALLFLHYSAPDLAITQILVEALTVMLLMLVVYKLPPVRREPRPGVAAAKWALAAGFGGGMTLIVLQALELQVAPSISEQLATWSYPAAHGRNVVNVILVDFRALDTFGEMIVLTIAALGVLSLLARRKRKREDAGS
ncbi:MAG: DUF4040 domain-containing protein [Verrucomicrobia bacterium]|nr:MAG: DUF4040 domain-containing protein [Verrucomicrobiota bacterium]